MGDDGIDVENNSTVHNSGTITGTGDDGIDIDDDGVVNNYSTGIIIGGNGDGIEAKHGLTVNNTGSITGSDDGISAFNGADITNNLGGTITGLGNDGISAWNDAEITNNGTITGGDRGINAEGSDNLIVKNYGSIIGLSEDGIDTNDGANITNYFGGIITGMGDDGIDVEDNSTVNNSGSITGTGDDGVDIDNGGTVNNYSTGVITGSNGDGINAEHSNNLTVENTGSITGSDDGIDTNDDASITNNVGGTITGLNGDGIALSSGTVTNNNGGTIRANNGVGVIKDSGGVADIMNMGLITGLTGIELSGNSEDIVDNSGTITGTDGTAIKMGLGDDTVFLKNGSLVNGEITGQEDFDIINFAGTNITNGDIKKFEEAYKYGGGYSLVNGRLQTDYLNVTSGQLTLTDGLKGTDSQNVVTTDVSNGELGGEDTFRSDMTNIYGGGILSPGLRPLSVNSAMAVGSLRHNGDLNFYAGSVNRVDFNPITTTHDVIRMDGDLIINPGSVMLVGPTNVDSPLQDGDYTVINDNGANTSAAFNSVSFTLDPTVVHGEEQDSPYNVTNTGIFNSSVVRLSSHLHTDDVQLEVEHDYTNISGLSDSGNAFAEYLNDILSEAPDHSTLADFLGFIDYSDEDMAADVLNSYDPTLHISAGDTLLHTGHSLNRLVENHLDLLRHKGVTPAPAPQYDAKGGMAPDDKSGYIAPAYGHKWTAWVSGSFESLNYERGGSSSSSLKDLDGDTAAATFGIDYKVNDTFYLGIMGQLGRTDLDEGSYTEVETDSSYFGLYGTYDNPSGYYLDFLLAYGDHDIDTQRFVYPGSTSASYGADGFTGMIGGGYMMGDQGVWRWGPVASLEYQSMDIDSFSESGLLGLSVNSRDVDSLRTLLGIKAEYTGGRFDWYGAVRWAHDFSGDDDRDITAGFAGIGGGFTTSAYDRAEDALILNLGVNSNITESFSVGLGYFGEISLDDNGVDSHGGFLEAAFSF